MAVSSQKAVVAELSKLEFRYRVLLGKCDLIGELKISTEEFQEITGLIAPGLADRIDDSEEFESFCRQFRAVISVFLTFAAVYDYQSHGNYWSGVWTRLSLKDVPYGRQSTLGEIFREFLKEANLVQCKRKCGREMAYVLTGGNPVKKRSNQPACSQPLEPAR